MVWNVFRRRRNNIFRSFGLTEVSCTSRRAIIRMVESWERETDKEYCLDIGSTDRSGQYVTLDFEDGADYVGDIRALFAPQGGYEATPSLLSLPEDFFKLIRMSHLVEHIEWLYQRSLFEWVFEFLADGGHLILDTPNLEYIIDVYTRNMSAAAKGKSVSYPYKDHPDFYTDGEISNLLENLVPWVNYKLYSGCSFNGTHYDFHHTCFNIFWLGLLLEQAGFVKIRIYNGKSIYAVATKPTGGLQWE